MKIKCPVVVSIAFILLNTSCSARYMEFREALSDLNQGTITREEYSLRINKFYFLNNRNFLPNSKIKQEGSYVNVGYDQFENKKDYRTFKFTNSGVVFASYQFHEPLINSNLAKTEGVKNRYTTNGNELIIEYLLHRDYELFNIFQHAKITENGEKLTFYRTENLQRPESGKESSKEKVYIYDPTLTALPILPH
jgi:hypothetical protein